MNHSVTLQNLDEATGNWLFAEAQKRNVSVETLTIVLLHKGIEKEQEAVDRKAHFQALERQHAEAYAKIPVKPGEFEEWEAEQIWGDE